MKKTLVKPAKKPARPARQPRQAAVEVMRPEADRRATAAERRTFAALIATGSSQAEAYRALRPGCDDRQAIAMGYKWAHDFAEEVRNLQSAAAVAAALAHGITAAWVLGEAKEMYLTPLSSIGSDSRFCKKHKVTTTHTDAGPKVTTEVEKDAPLAILRTISELAGIDGSQLRAAAETPAETSQEAEKAALSRALSMIIGPGSPIARRIQEVSNTQMTGK
jgi:hypothetical protein